MITHTYTERADGAFDLSISGVANTPAPVGSPPPVPVPPPAPSGSPIAVERATASHVNGVGTFPVVFKNATGAGYSRFLSRDMSGTQGQRNKDCFSMPFRVEPSASSVGVDLSAFEIAPYQNSASYDVSISKTEGDFTNAVFTALDQGTSPSISFALNEAGRAGASCNLTPGDYYFNVGWASQLDAYLAKPNGYNNNCNVIVRGAD